MIEAKKIQEFENSVASGLDGALDFLESEFRSSGEYHRLFDVLKMRIRKELGLSLLHRPDDLPLEEESQQKLEESFLEACREVASLYLAEGNLNDGWIYLQPLGDEPFARELIEKVEVTEENFSALIEIAFNNGVAPEYGYRLMLERAGTCNGITAFDVQAMQFDRNTVSSLASLLLNHFCEEIRVNVIEHVRNVEGRVDDSLTLGEYLEKYEWLVREGGHHTDATHLASIIRIARQTSSENNLRKALSLANYGCRLSEDFRFASDPPFEDIYEDHRIWFEALNGINVDSAVAHFREKVEQSSGQFHEAAVVEALVDLLIRTGNRDAAVETMTQKIFHRFESDELPPAAFDVAKSSSQFEQLATSFREKDNFAGFAFSVLCREEQKRAEN